MRVEYVGQIGHNEETLAEDIGYFLSQSLEVPSQVFGKNQITGRTYVDFEWPAERGVFPLDTLIGIIWLMEAKITGESSVVYNEVITQAEVTALVAGILEGKAQEYGYDSMLSAVSYWHSENVKFRREGQAFSKWRDQVWQRCFEIIEATSGDMSQINVESEVAALPVFEDVLESIDE